MPGNPCLKPHGQSFDRGAATFVITLHCSTDGVRCGLYPSAMVLDLVPTSGCCHWRAQSPVFLPSQFEEVMVAALAAKRRWHRGVAHYREWSLFWGLSDEYTCVCKRRLVKRGQLPQHNKGWSLRECGWVQRPGVMWMASSCSLSPLPNPLTPQYWDHAVLTPKPKSQSPLLHFERGVSTTGPTDIAGQSPTCGELGAPPSHSTPRGYFYRMSMDNRGPPLTLYSIRPQSQDPSGFRTASPREERRQGGDGVITRGCHEKIEDPVPWTTWGVWWIRR